MEILAKKEYKFKTITKKRLADTVTPVSIFLRIRDKFANSILLESSDYHAKDNSFSYICCNPIATFEVSKGIIKAQYPKGKENKQSVHNQDVPSALLDFASCFQSEDKHYKFITNGLFGYQAYDAIQYYENLEIQGSKSEKDEIPDILYHAYRFVIAINHFNSELYIFEHLLEGETSEIHRIETYIKSANTSTFDFSFDGAEGSNMTDEEYLAMARKGKEHCHRGDVFQIVLSRRYEQGFQGDEFNVYRALRAINPSPYLFYFDYGSFKLFGSSPEAQIVIQKNTASIHPIAGTFKRTGDDAADAELAKQLALDPKENAEHVMLVDLARNDLSRHGNNVRVETFQEVQFYSHVIHLVSKVTGDLEEGTNPLQLVADTFPAGTLSGAPKYRAMELINKYEKTNRSFYGGCIGYLGFNGNFNHAIMIRSFRSMNNKLYYQAGGGIVFKSLVENELQEVHNKLRALRKALELAVTL